MTTAILKNADWTKRSSRFYALGSSFAIGALISSAHLMTGGWWRIQRMNLSWPEDAEREPVTSYLIVIAATLAWGALVSMLLASGCRRDVSRKRVSEFAALACFPGWDAGWRMMQYTFGWHGPC